MLKIDITDSPDERGWSLHGGLAGEWATELKLAWRKVRHQGDTHKCVIDLTQVTHIDRSGETVLAEMMAQGAEFVAKDLYTKGLLRRLRAESTRSRVAKRREDRKGKGG